MNGALRPSYSRSSSTPTQLKNDHDDSLPQSAAVNGYEPLDGDRTPTATQQHLPLPTAKESHQTTNVPPTRPTPASSFRTPSYADDASSTLAPSTLNAYAASVADTTTSLLNGQHPRSRYASEPALHKKTKGRKAFVGLCDAINLVVPIDINHDATSMKESSMARTKNAVQDWTQKRRSTTAGIIPVGRGDEARSQA